ncbi:hypothetical protein [Clostridium lacusfryxellense]|uniref:hypothetical protein n=1 Tax=Clostridium lacusfryxellense TaxID=205328 RepID=UPI001C0B0622|nr:hypothetical protein [Clostridium lacusfryxellense]MBU3113677.1 hypothetical protein [Clostridium lacusfryxellense]
MDKFKKYRKIRRWLEFASSMIAIIIGSIISSYLGIYNKKLISLDTALNVAIIVAIVFVLNNISIKIVDNWYKKDLDKYKN